MLDRRHIGDWEGRDVLDERGDKIGSVDEIYLDDATAEPEFALVKSGLFGISRHFVPLREAIPEGDKLRVPYSKDTVRQAPTLDPDGDLTRADEAQLYEYYGLEYSEVRSAAGLSGGPTQTQESRDDAMARSEETRVGTRGRDVGGARLRKYAANDTAT